MQFDRDHLVLYLKQAATLLVVFVIIKFGWAFWKSTQFRMAMSDATREGATMHQGVDNISDKIVWHARELGVTMRQGDPHVDVDPKSRMVTARAVYAVPVNLYAKSFTLKFHYSTAGTPVFTTEDFKNLGSGSDGGTTHEVPAPSNDKPSVPDDWWKNPPGS